MLFNEPKLLKSDARTPIVQPKQRFSALQRAEIAEMLWLPLYCCCLFFVSVLFNEPKLLKCSTLRSRRCRLPCFSALQRAEIAEIHCVERLLACRASFSALQRAEIAEIDLELKDENVFHHVSVLFNEPKLLKFCRKTPRCWRCSVSVLFNEPKLLKSGAV